MNWDDIVLIIRVCLSVAGANHLSTSLTKAHRGLVKLSLSHCGLTGKGIAQIGHALTLNKFMSSSLTHLDLSSNAAKDDINVIIFNPCFLVTTLWPLY